MPEETILIIFLFAVFLLCVIVGMFILSRIYKNYKKGIMIPYEPSFGTPISYEKNKKPLQYYFILFSYLVEALFIFFIGVVMLYLIFKWNLLW